MLRKTQYRFAFLAARGALLVGAVCTSPASFAVDAATCTARSVLPESQVVTCAIDPSSVGRTVRFVAQFTGSHDDTRLTLTATLNGEPLSCAAGSKTNLAAEDGEVSLDCRFRVDSSSASSPVLEVALAVHHAQYLSAALVTD